MHQIGGCVFENLHQIGGCVFENMHQIGGFHVKNEPSCSGRFYPPSLSAVHFFKILFGDFMQIFIFPTKRKPAQELYLHIQWRIFLLQLQFLMPVHRLPLPVLPRQHITSFRPQVWHGLSAHSSVCCDTFPRKKRQTQPSVDTFQAAVW